MTLSWHIRDRRLEIGARSLILAIVNVTPDSFSDGGSHATTGAAIAHALRLVDEGAELLDLGGESTRPGATPIETDEELRRVVPVVEGLIGRTTVPISIDTRNPQVARHCLEAGAQIINDVEGLTRPEMVEVVRAFGAGAIVMHMQGTPQTMQIDPRYVDVVTEVRHFLGQRLESLADQGIEPAKLVLDPGIGFGKTLEHTLAQLVCLGTLRELGRPICLGVSRKGFLKALTGRNRDERATASALVGFYGAMQGAAHLLRVHDVPQTRDAVFLAQALREAETTFR